MTAASSPAQTAAPAFLDAVLSLATTNRRIP
jgi:hypothetical protein